MQKIRNLNIVTADAPNFKQDYAAGKIISGADVDLEMHKIRRRHYKRSRPFDFIAQDHSLSLADPIESFKKSAILKIFSSTSQTSNIKKIKAKIPDVVVHPTQKDIDIWMIKAKSKEKWQTLLSISGECIVEFAPNKKQYRKRYLQHQQANKYRVTFMQMTDDDGEKIYRFCGLFEWKAQNNSEKNALIWHRIDTRFALNF